MSKEEQAAGPRLALSPCPLPVYPACFEEDGKGQNCQVQDEERFGKARLIHERSDRGPWV